MQKKVNKDEFLDIFLKDYLKKRNKEIVNIEEGGSLSKFDIVGHGGNLRRVEDVRSKGIGVYYASAKCFGDKCDWIVITINAGMIADDRENSNFVLGLVSTGAYYSFGTTENDEVCGQFEYKSAGFSSQFNSDQFATSSDMLHVSALALKSAIMSAFGIRMKNIVVCVANKVYCKASYFDRLIKYGGFSDQFSDQFYKGE